MPGSSFVNPGTKLRQELTRAAVYQVTENGWVKENYRPLGKLRDGDMVRVCAETGELTALVDESIWDAREQANAPATAVGTGRELFAMLRRYSDPAEKGGSAMLAEAGL